MQDIAALWRERSTRDKALIVTGAIVFVASIVIIAVTISKRPGPEVCNTDACHNAARIFLANLNKNGNPCDDFYDFACGRYEEGHKLSPDQTSRSEIRDIAKLVRDRIKGLFNSTHDKEEKVHPIKWVKTFYNQCKDREALNKHGIRILKNITKGFGGWSDDESRTVEENLVEAQTQYGINAIFTVRSSANPYDPSRQVLMLSSPEFAISGADLRGKDDKSKKIVKAYKKFVKVTGQLLKREEIAKNADKIVEFERKLAKITTPREHDPTKSNHNMTLKGAMDAIGAVKKVSILRLVQKILSRFELQKEIKPETTVIVHNLEYLKKVAKVLEETDDSVINNYLGWTVVFGGGGLTTDQFRENELEFLKVSRGIKELPKLEDTCIQRAGVLSMAIGRLYVDSFFTDGDKKSSEEIIKDILTVFKDTIGGHDWLDEQTRKAAVEKAVAMRIKMGFPQWIKDDDKLSKEYDVGPIKDTALENLHRAISSRVKANFANLDTPTDWTKHGMGPHVVNAAYSGKENSINFPAGILQGLFFNASRPAYLNFGSIGVVAGHEVSHGFDNSGSRFDKDGKLNNWWTEKSRENFENRAKCFEEQYSAIKDNQTGLYLKGKLTLGENIADNGGLNVAFAAWKKVSNDRFNKQLLPGMEEWTQDQLFFFSRANELCGVATTESLRNQIRSNEHSPNRYRVNVPFMNSPEFATAFKCKEGSKMIPKKRCAIW